MKSALIPPIPHLDLAAGREYHLVLNHLLELPDYRAFCTAEALGGSFIILDNSAHEQTSGGPIDSLLTNGLEIGAREIVMPDTLFDEQETLIRSLEAMDHILEDGQETFQQYSPRLAVVAQGTDYATWAWCLWGLIAGFEARRGQFEALGCPGLTLSVSKDYEVFDGGIHHLLETQLIPAARKYGHEIHLLGWGRKLWELKRIVRDFGDEIRSTDSAKPFVYGYAGIVLDPENEIVPAYPTRPKDYFNLTMIPTQICDSLINVGIFDQIVSGETNDQNLSPSV